MRLLRLKLENFRQHLSTEVEFADGMTAIVGPNGTGKTTMLEAITFALFGDSRGKVDDIRFYWAEARKKYVARLTFQLGERTFEVERSTYDASLKEVSGGNEKVWATGKAGTTAQCEALLGLSYEQFINSFCAEQKCLRFLDFKDNRERQAEVARMLGYDRLELAENLATDRRKDFFKQRGWMESALRDPAALETEKQMAQQKLVDAKLRSEQAKELKKEQEAKLPTAKEASDRASKWLTLTQQMDVIASKADGLKSNLKTTSDAVSEGEKEVLELVALRPVEQQYQQLCAKIEAGTKAYQEQLRREELAKQADGLLVEIEALGKQLEEIVAPDLKLVEGVVQEAIKAHAAAQSACEAASKAWADLRVKAQADLTEAKTIYVRATADLKIAEEMVAKGMCPECGQPITASYEEVLESRRKSAVKARDSVTALEIRAASAESKPKELVEAEAYVDTAAASHRQKQASFEEARRVTDKANHLREQQKGAQVKREALLSQMAKIGPASVEINLPALKAELGNLEPKHARYLAIQNAESKLVLCKERNESAKKEHDEAREKYQVLNKERHELAFASREEACAAEDALRTLRAQIEMLGANILLATEQESSAKKELEVATKAIAEYKHKKKEIAELQQKEVLHGATATELKGLRLFLNSELGPELEARASENVSLLTNGRYSKISLDKNFGATLFDDDDVHKPVISGGEEDVVALSLRLALSELIQERQGRPMSLLILDEVFGSLDVDRRQSVMDRLAALKGRFDQILVISHIEEINQVADQCLYLSRDSSSRATQVTDAPPLGFAEL